MIDLEYNLGFDIYQFVGFIFRHFSHIIRKVEILPNSSD